MNKDYITLILSVNMEDTNRIRTKLRLDLEDISNQIDDLEDMMKKDKSPDLIEDHKKLVKYEKKLKEQYERMTGFSIEQAATLRGSKRTKELTPSGWGKFYGFIAGILFAEAFFNLIIHGIIGYGIEDVIGFFLLGTVNAVPYGLNVIIEHGAMDGDSRYITLATLTAPVIATVFESLAGRARKEIYSVMEGLALTLPPVYIIFRFSVPHATNTFVNEIFIFSILLFSSAFFMFLSGFGGGFFNKIIAITSAGLFAYSGYVAYNASLASDVAKQIGWDWPYLFAPLMMVGFVMAIGYLFGFIKD